MDTLMRMQASYDIAQTRKREKQIHVRRIPLAQSRSEGTGHRDLGTSLAIRSGRADLKISHYDGCGIGRTGIGTPGPSYLRIN